MFQRAQRHLGDCGKAGLAAAERVYAWEKEYELDIRVAALPPGVDPDDLARNDPGGLQRAVDEAVPFLKFRLERVLEAGDMSTAEGKARTAEHALDVVREHPDPLVRDQYVIEIADRTRIDLARLRELLASPARPRPATPQYGSPPVDVYDDVEHEDHRPPERMRLTPEDEAIRLMIHRPGEVAGRLAPVLFGDPTRREAFEALQFDGVMAAADRVGGRAASLLRRLAVESSDAETDDVVAGVVRLSADRVVRDLQHRARRAESVADRQGFATAIAWVKTQTEGLAERNTREAAVAQLLPWLIQNAEGRNG